MNQEDYDRELKAATKAYRARPEWMKRIERRLQQTRSERYERFCRRLHRTVFGSYNSVGGAEQDQRKSTDTEFESPTAPLSFGENEMTIMNDWESYATKLKESLHHIGLAQQVVSGGPGTFYVEYLLSCAKALHEKHAPYEVGEYISITEKNATNTVSVTRGGRVVGCEWSCHKNDWRVTVKWCDSGPVETRVFYLSEIQEMLPAKSKMKSREEIEKLVAEIRGSYMELVDECRDEKRVRQCDEVQSDRMIGIMAALEWALGERSPTSDSPWTCLDDPTPGGSDLDDIRKVNEPELKSQELGNFQVRHNHCLPQMPPDWQEDFDKVPKDCAKFCCLPEVACTLNHPNGHPKYYVQYKCLVCGGC